MPIHANTRTIHRPVGPVAYDCVKLIVVRDGSAILFSEFGERPINVGDVVLLAANTLCGSEPEGHITVSTIYADADYVLDQLFWQHADLLCDRLDTQALADTIYTEPAQILRLGEGRAGMLMPWVDELVALTADGIARHRFHRAQALWFSIIDQVAPFIRVSPHRPDLMRMIKYVTKHKVDYCIVHKVDRLARNRADDVAIHLALRDAGVMLVSATENIDETPSGMLLHGIMSTIAEFYSRNLATETVKGLSQKAASGGTVTKAPLGYRNVGVRDEYGREIRTVEVDQERAKLIRWAFQVYASGEWSTNQLHAELTARGLTTPPTPRRPSKPIGRSSLHRILTNPYYKGDVTYQGVTYKGTHEALVPAEVWYQVQTVLSMHRSAADATQIHDHYLKGTVFCGQCGARLLVCNAKNARGNIYPYFVCGARHSGRGDCTRQAMLIEEVERLIERHYETVQITKQTRQAVGARLHAAFDELMASESDALAAMATERTRLEDEQLRVLQAHYAGAVPLDLLKKEQDRISAALETIEHRITAHHGEYADARANLDDSLDLLEHAAEVYARCDDANRRLCNQAFFTAIYIDEDNDVRVGYATPFDALTDRELQSNALAWAEGARNESEVRTPTGSTVESSHLAHLG